jgi:hypothetical protein
MVLPRAIRKSSRPVGPHHEITGCTVSVALRRTRLLSRCQRPPARRHAAETTATGWSPCPPIR